MKALIIVLLLAVPVQAQDESVKVARTVSWVALGAGVGLDTWDAFHQDDKKRALFAEGTGLLFVGLSTLAMKRAFPEDRPCAKQMDCGSEDPHASWWSGHSGNACFVIPTGSGKVLAITGIALAGIVMVGRVAGNEHHWWDAAAGCAAGVGSHALMKKVFKTQ